MDELELELRAKCRVMREGAELLLEALRESPALFLPQETEAARRLALNTLAAVESFEAGYENSPRMPEQPRASQSGMGADLENTVSIAAGCSRNSEDGEV